MTWQEAPRVPWTQRQLAVLLGLVVIAAVLRLLRVEAWSFGGSEVATWAAMTRPFAGSAGIEDPYALHPLVVMLMRALLDTGVLPFADEAWLRLPFVFAGITAVPVMALTGKRLLGDPRMALVATGLLAVHPWHVATSQSATPVGVSLLFALAALGAAPAPGSGRPYLRWVTSVLCALLAIGCHPGGWLVLPMLVAKAVADAWPRLATSARIAAVVGLFAAPLLPLLGLLWSGWSLTGGAGAAVDPFAACVEAVGWPTLVLASAAYLVVRPLPATVAFDGAAAVLALCFVALVGVPIAAEAVVVVLPGLLFLATLTCWHTFQFVRAGLAVERRLVTAASALVLATLVLTLLVDSVLYLTVHEGRRPRWREAAALTGDAVASRRGILVGAGSGWPSLTYYLRPNHWRDLRIDPHPRKRVVPLALAAPATDLTELLAMAHGEVVFLVLRGWEFAAVEAEPAAKAQLWASFRLVEVMATPLHGGEESLYLFRSLEAK